MTPVTLQQVDDRLAEFRQELYRYFAPSDLAGRVESLDGWRKKVFADGSFGRILNGPHWLDGVSVQNNTIGADKLTAELIFTKILTLSAGGYIQDADGSKWDQDGITLNTPSGGGAGDTITWTFDDDPFGTIYTQADAFHMAFWDGVGLGGRIFMQDDRVVLVEPGDNQIQVRDDAIEIVTGGSTPPNVAFDGTNKRAMFGGRIYPGDGTTSPSQTSDYIHFDGSKIAIQTGALGISGNAALPGLVFGAISSGGTVGNWTGSALDGGGFIRISIGGTTRRVPIFANA